MFPYRALIADNTQIGFDLVKASKEACAQVDVLLKVIIESGELKEEALIRQASEIAIDAGADFIKTSTGKVPVNATPEVAQIMMSVIRDKGVKQQVGFKPAGGVRSAEDAALYLKLADDILGRRLGRSAPLPLWRIQPVSQPAERAGPSDRQQQSRLLIA